MPSDKGDWPSAAAPNSSPHTEQCHHFLGFRMRQAEDGLVVCTDPGPHLSLAFSGSSPGACDPGAETIILAAFGFLVAGL